MTGFISNKLMWYILDNFLFTLLYYGINVIIFFILELRYICTTVKYMRTKQQAKVSVTTAVRPAAVFKSSTLSLTYYVFVVDFLLVIYRYTLQIKLIKIV